MKRILFINPPVVCVNECQLGWYSFAHPTSILKLIAWHRLQGNEPAFIDCMDYDGGSTPGTAETRKNTVITEPGANIPRSGSGNLSQKKTSIAEPSADIHRSDNDNRSQNNITITEPVADKPAWQSQPYKKLPLGSSRLRLYIDTHILGKTMHWLEGELKKQTTPDEIWVSCHMTFNNELAHETIRTAKRVFPEAVIRLGGNYATLFPEEAQSKSGASVFKGLFAGAELLFPDYSLFQGPLDYMVFQLDLGCDNHCSHCVNSLLHQEIIRLNVPALVQDLKLKKERYGVSHFVNIDPNVACFDLQDFLQECIHQKLDASLYFYGGIQPDKVTPELASIMHEAGVRGLTLPRELETDSNRQLQKSYSPGSFYNAVDSFQKAGFDLSDFHCSFPVGFMDDNLIELTTIIREIRDMGAIPEIAPVAFVPGTPEYRRHAPLLHGKTLVELNWALWPALDSTDAITTHAILYNAAHGNRFNKPWSLKSAVRDHRNE